MLAINSVSNWEGISDAMINSTKDKATQNAITLLRDERIAEGMNGITSSQLFTFGVIIIGVILVAMIASYLLLHFGFKIDEAKEKQMVEELALRHKQDEEKKDGVGAETATTPAKEGETK